MGGVLLALKRGAIDLAARGNLGGDGRDGAIAEGGGGFGGLIEQGKKLGSARRPTGHGFSGSQVRLLA
jgi:hypothetical protein